MSRMALTLLLLLHILPAFSAAGNSRLQQLTASHSTTQSFFSKSSLSTHAPGDIQNSNLTAVTGQQQAQQRTVSLCYYAGNGSSVACLFPHTNLSAAPVELFDNNSLTHNYPAHNFW